MELPVWSNYDNNYCYIALKDVLPTTIPTSIFSLTSHLAFLGKPDLRISLWGAQAGWRVALKSWAAGVAGVARWPLQRGCCRRCKLQSSACRGGTALFGAGRTPRIHGQRSGKPATRICPKRAFPIHLGGGDCPWVPGPSCRSAPRGDWEGAHSGSVLVVRWRAGFPPSPNFHRQLS